MRGVGDDTLESTEEEAGQAPNLGFEMDAGEKKEEETALVSYDSLQRYLAEIRRYPILSREEEYQLAIRYREEGDLPAAYKLVVANLRLVVLIARMYQKASRSLMDLIQEGNVGLMEAVRNFDPYRGVRFPSYAVWWIRAYIIRYLMNNLRMVKIGTTQAQRKLFFNLQKEKERLEREGFSPGPKLLAQRLNVREDEVVEMEQRLGGRDVSVDMPIDEGEESTLLDVLPNKGQTAEEEVADLQYKEVVSRKVAEFAQGLRGKEKVIFERRLLADDPLTLQEIGDQYRISRERVRQIESRLKKKLKNFLLAEVKDIRDLDLSASS